MEKHKINSVEMVRKIRDKQSKEVKDHSLEEQKKHFNKKTNSLKAKLTKQSQEIIKN